MKPTTLSDLKTLLANLKSAIANRQSVTIAGGIFHGDELKALLYAVEVGVYELEHRDD